MMRWIFVTLALFSSMSLAVIETYEFDSQEQRARYKQFVAELRCPKCQNQNIADSNAPIASDLRKELHRLLGEGKTDEEIINYMVQRYGEFVLYKPPVNNKTIILWAAPAIFLIIGLFALAFLLFRQKTIGASAKTAVQDSLTDEERSRLKKLLGEDRS